MPVSYVVKLEGETGYLNWKTWSYKDNKENKSMAYRDQVRGKILVIWAWSGRDQGFTRRPVFQSLLCILGLP